jgi:hypothetical protein
MGNARLEFQVFAAMRIFCIRIKDNESRGEMERFEREISKSLDERL